MPAPQCGPAHRGAQRHKPASAHDGSRGTWMSPGAEGAGFSAPAVPALTTTGSEAGASIWAAQAAAV